MPACVKSELAKWRGDPMLSPEHDASSALAAGDQNADQMARMIRGYWISQIVGTFAQLGIPDRLAHGPMEAGEIARSIACDADATCRLLRVVFVVGFVASFFVGWFGFSFLRDLLW